MKKTNESTAKISEIIINKLLAYVRFQQIVLYVVNTSYLVLYLYIYFLI